jgi:hypothetical protein
VLFGGSPKWGLILGVAFAFGLFSPFAIGHISGVIQPSGFTGLAGGRFSADLIRHRGQRSGRLLQQGAYIIARRAGFDLASASLLMARATPGGYPTAGLVTKL